MWSCCEIYISQKKKTTEYNNRKNYKGERNEWNMHYAKMDFAEEFLKFILVFFWCLNGKRRRRRRRREKLWVVKTISLLTSSLIIIIITRTKSLVPFQSFSFYAAIFHRADKLIFFIITLYSSFSMWRRKKWNKKSFMLNTMWCDVRLRILEQRHYVAQLSRESHWKRHNKKNMKFLLFLFFYISHHQKLKCCFCLKLCSQSLRSKYKIKVQKNIWLASIKRQHRHVQFLLIIRVINSSQCTHHCFVWRECGPRKKKNLWREEEKKLKY
jgi:hypothetical protein